MVLATPRGPGVGGMGAGCGRGGTVVVFTRAGLAACGV